MSQALALAVLAGIVSGGLGLAPLSGSFGLVLLSYFVEFPVMLVGLTMGLAAALIAVAAAMVLSGLLAGFVPSLIYAVAFALPALLVVRQALLSRQDPSGLVWYPPGHVLAQLTVLSVIGLGFAFLALMGQPGGLIGVIEKVLVDAAGLLSEAAGQPVPEPALLRSSAVLVPAIVASSWLIMAVVNAVAAQAIAKQTGWNRRPSPTLRDLELPFWLWPLIAGAAVLSLFGSTGIGLFGRSALLVLIVPFGFLGLAVIHKFADRWSYRQVGLAAIYVGIMLFGWPILVVIALGLVEDWAHLRRYM